jgi:hypothetical protein
LAERAPAASPPWLTALLEALTPLLEADGLSS